MATPTNTIAQHVLYEYLKLENPGYALLIDAPWGAGKTHFIKKHAKYETDPEILYVSLNGIENPKNFNLAVLRAMKPFGIDGAGNWGKSIKDFSSGIQIFGCSVDFNRIPLEEFALTKLPNTLIFDDLERCTMKHDQLSGLLNQFIEHEEKRIILIANTDEHKEKERFSKTREKLIGRTLVIEADIDEAIIAIWSNIPKGKAKKFLQSIQSELLGTFREADHNNLRVTKHALLETSLFLDKIEDSFFENEVALTKVITTYFALCMAYKNGSIKIENLMQRNDYSLFMKDENSKDTDIEILQKKHPNKNIIIYNAPILPAELATNSIGKGYASADEINAALKSTHQFSKPADKPDWIRLWNWPEEETNAIKELIATTNNKLINLEIIDPGEIVQTYGSMKFMAQVGAIDDDEKKVHKNFMDYLDNLEVTQKIPSFFPGHKLSSTSNEDDTSTKTDYARYGYSNDYGRVRYDGYEFGIEGETEEFLHKLKKLQDKAYKKNLVKYADQMLELLINKPQNFINHFSYKKTELNFYKYEILDKLEPDNFAKILLSHFTENKNLFIEICRALVERMELNQGFEKEKLWFKKMKNSFKEQATNEDKILGAQIGVMINRYLEPR